MFYSKKKFAFISRHVPTPEQEELAALQNVVLEHVGDADAFSVTPEWVRAQGDYFDGVVVVHPAAAMRLCQEFLVGSFKNADRAPIGEKPRFEAVEFEVYDRRL